MWMLPLAASVISLVFALMLGRQWLARRRSPQALWAIALLMYAGASFALFLGSFGGWTPAEYRTYWLLGAVLNVPFLAQGELNLLVRSRSVTGPVLLLVLFGTGYATAKVMRAPLDPQFLTEALPSGKAVFGEDGEAYRLAPLFSYPAYAVLVAGALWSAWRMRGRRELRERFVGTLLIALGATVVAGGAAFAVTGFLLGFSLTLAGGVGLMFWGFLRASHQPPASEPTPVEFAPVPPPA